MNKLEYRESCGHIKYGWCDYCLNLWKEAYFKGKEDAVISKKGYMCSTDYEFELGSASGGSKVYSSIEDLVNNKKCHSSCGIFEVEILLKRKIDILKLY